VPDRILASSASSSTQLASFHYTDAKPSVDPIEEAFLNTLLGIDRALTCSSAPKHFSDDRQEGTDRRMLHR